MIYLQSNTSFNSVYAAKLGELLVCFFFGYFLGFLWLSSIAFTMLQTHRWSHLICFVFYAIIPYFIILWVDWKLAMFSFHVLTNASVWVWFLLSGFYFCCYCYHDCCSRPVVYEVEHSKYFEINWLACKFGPWHFETGVVYNYYNIFYWFSETTIN